jgi:hypothetical protein
MNSETTPPNFRLIAIEPFDARRGMDRCSTPGIGVSIAGRRGGAVADFWQNKHGQLAIRLTCSGDSPIHFFATLSDGRPFHESEDLQDFVDYMEAVLLGWFTGGNENFSYKLDPYFLQAFIDGAEHLENKFYRNCP